MQVIRGESDRGRVVVDAEVRRLIDLRISAAVAWKDRFGEAVFFVVIEPGDGIDEVNEQLGFSVLGDRVGEPPSGTLKPAPPSGLIEEHDGCFELTYQLAPDGSGVVVFIPKKEGVAPELSGMCSRYVAEGDGL